MSEALTVILMLVGYLVLLPIIFLVILVVWIAIAMIVKAIIEK